MSANRYRETLPASWFTDPDHYRRELRDVWSREWLCIGRDNDWAEPGTFRRIDVGDQQIIVTRAVDGRLNAFHNTCRHRGAALCEADTGQFHGGRIVCPYHAWAYGLDGRLLKAPLTTGRDKLNTDDFPLYRVAVDDWRGFVFINLDPEPGRSLTTGLGDEAGNVAAWPLEDLHRVQRDTHELACNWKVFWENYNECYHCPGVHPDLVRLVPVYRTGFMEYADAGVSPADPAQPAAMLRENAATWSKDGAAQLPAFDGLGTEDRQRGMTFATFLPTMFIVAHVDYVRTVHVLPLGPERTQLVVDWYVHRDLRDDPRLDADHLAAFARQVVAEDARVCELNQQGLRCSRHETGVLLEVEDYVYAFEQWLRERLRD